MFAHVDHCRLLITVLTINRKSQSTGPEQSDLSFPLQISPVQAIVMFISIVLLWLCFFFILLQLKPRRPKNFPPGPPILPVLGNLWYLTSKNPLKDFEKVRIPNGLAFSLSYHFKLQWRIIDSLIFCYGDSVPKQCSTCITGPNELCSPPLISQRITEEFMWLNKILSWIFIPHHTCCFKILLMIEKRFVGNFKYSPKYCLSNTLYSESCNKLHLRHIYLHDPQSKETVPKI